MKFNAPTVLTLLRIALIPVFILFYIYHRPVIACAVFIIASITDFFDGYIARKKNLVSDFGKLADPLADKILVISALVLFVEYAQVPTWTVIVIIARELTVSGLRSIAATKGTVIAADWSGKFKTVFQMIAIIFILLGEWVRSLIGFDLGIWLYYIALALTVYSGCEYLVKNRAVFAQNEEK